MLEVTLWKTDRGTVCQTRDEAERTETIENTEAILENLDLYWRETSPEAVARELQERGYRIVSV